ncbi:hypothetical protein BO70DRAFT_381678 [Aspergillus heteromorphus CBS 117.55]|uniref:Uncharacterized protein n=1 Tax=Aspergillus heteromorphus CBS 117.55 TaxID=1448321 RepID=A0A317VHA7_9EURO|nr:uncharacterized protein BO70DRAFT_381678 [Aspergillus heteromorphus CBS 117.55]PWY73744.1 hypothetical protein BO70DRAFT_381678 [Aspergillus heteromorphus CBS 117.55]
MPFLQERTLHRICQYGLLSLSLLRPSAAGSSEASTGLNGYTYGQSVPVTCLNRTIDSGEHITDPHGKLQYIPFPTCNETSLPLSLPYSTTTTITCTIASLPDDLYHLLEYYVHSDVPMTCRVPTAPLAQQQAHMPLSEGSGSGSDIDVLDTDGPAYTPLTFAVQGTLQRSHLHIWTDMNVLVHSIYNQEAGEKAGYVVAGTAYSVPEFDAASLRKLEGVSGSGGGKGGGGEGEDGDVAGVVAEAAREPWTAGHGTKVVRGEPLTFSFHVSWVHGARGIGWPASSSSGDDEVERHGSGWFSKLLFFGVAASVGALVALYWERSTGGMGRRRGGMGSWGFRREGRGRWVLGLGMGGGAVGMEGIRRRLQVAVVRWLGHGGYGYGGYMSGKRD